MAIDWGNIENQYSSDYKDYAKPGIYKVKCDDVEIKQVGSNGNYIMKFHFAETGKLQYPTADHWLSKNNQNWRIYHTRMLYEALGAPEANAKKVCEMAESKDDYEFAVKAYTEGFNKLLAKEPEVEIEVFQDGKYMRSEFTDSSVAMPHDDAIDRTGDMLLEQSEEVEEEIDFSSMPF